MTGRTRPDAKGATRTSRPLCQSKRWKAQADLRRHTKPKRTSALPTSARALGSGINGGPEAQLGVPGVQALPTRKVSGVVPKSKVTPVIVVAAVMAESAISNVPVPLMYGEKFPFVIVG
jgi:hypothetical protein